MLTTNQHRSNAHHWAVTKQCQLHAAIWAAVFQSSPPFRHIRVIGDFYWGQELIFKEVYVAYCSHHLCESFRDPDCILYRFLDNNYRKTRRSSQKTEWATTPAKVLWANSRLHKSLPSREIHVFVIVLEMVLSMDSKCWVKDLAKMPGPGGWLSKEEKMLKESAVPWVELAYL